MRLVYRYVIPLVSCACEQTNACKKTNKRISQCMYVYNNFPSTTDLLCHYCLFFCVLISSFTSYIMTCFFFSFSHFSSIFIVFRFLFFFFFSFLYLNFQVKIPSRLPPSLPRVVPLPSVQCDLTLERNKHIESGSVYSGRGKREDIEHLDRTSF